MYAKDGMSLQRPSGCTVRLPWTVTMPAKRAQFLERCDPLQAPDVIASHIDVLPSER